MSRLSKIHFLKQAVAGDTIIEVLVAISIVSLTLVGAYASANKSSVSIRDTQEHHEALSLASAQLESLRSADGLPDGKECFAPNGVATTDATGHGCSFTTGAVGGCDTSTASYCYHAKITPVSTEGDIHTPELITTYKISIDWDGIIGNQDNATLFYKLSYVNVAYVAPPVTVEDAPTPPDDVDAPGNPSPPEDGEAKIGTTPCLPADPCSKVAGGGIYHFTFSFLNSTSALNVPDDQVKSCSWDFGDGTVLSLPSTDVSCHNGGSKTHSYKDAAEMQNLPAWPAACYKRDPSAGKVYTVKLQIYRYDGANVKPGTYSVYAPSCWGPGV